MELLNQGEEDRPEKIKGNFTPHKLEIKITKVFDKQIKFFIIQNKKLVAPKSLTAIDEQSFEKLQDKDILHKAALLLRKSVLQAEKNKLRQLITVEDLKEGEMSIPQDLLDFYFTLIAGSNQKRVEELETEAAYTSAQNSSICPETIVKSPLLCTGVAFDNFDRFVETKSGKDTLHDTVGIIYQNVELHTPNESQFVNLLAVNSEGTVISKKRRRRTLEAITVDMQEKPVAKRKKNYMDLSAHYGEYSLPANLQLYKTIDTAWMISHALKLPNVPMWVGFNIVH
ncbi:hypothetical protein TNCV_2351691 [Trichonephila clavipes]|nr:hypothetical protein TNCV_2351691 [Trichonephila clavipes]